MFCRKCGSQIPDGGRFCPKCGLPVAAPQAPVQPAPRGPEIPGQAKKPLYKRGWFIFLICIAAIPVLFIILTIIVAIASGPVQPPAEQAVPAETYVVQVETTVPATTKAEITYTVVSADQMVKLLEENALKAEKTYMDQYVEVTGRLDVIDSDGSYIGLFPINNEFCLTSVHCSIQNDDQLDQVLEMKKGDTVTVRGQIKMVGEIMGFSLDIDEIVK